MNKAIADIANQIQGIFDDDEIDAQEGRLVGTKLTITNLGYYREFTFVISGKHKQYSVGQRRHNNDAVSFIKYSRALYNDNTEGIGLQVAPHLRRRRENND